MKVLIITVAVILVIIIVFQSFITMSTNKTENQPYKLILKEAAFEIRFYPSATIASIQSNAKTYKELSGSGFRKLAGYIFGNNESAAKIAMTSPVHMQISDSQSAMSFVMPSAYNQANLPRPNDPGITISRTADEYVAAIEFGGFASDKELAMYSAKLQSTLKEKGITTNGPYRYLGYNPPFQLTNRRNEVIVQIEWNENNRLIITKENSTPAE